MSDHITADHHITVNDQFKSIVTKQSSNNKSSFKQKLFGCFVPQHDISSNIPPSNNKQLKLNNSNNKTINNSFITRTNNNNDAAAINTVTPHITIQHQQPIPIPVPQPTQQSSSIDSLVTQVQQSNNNYPSTLPQLTVQQLTAHINHQPPPCNPLLPPLSPYDITIKKKCLILDLDETLVHSSFKPINDADFIMTIELENVLHRVYVRKRPGVDEFLRIVGSLFEVIIFTASLAKYADPLLDILDTSNTIHGRLFRESCVQHYGNYVKDLSHLGRKLQHCIIIDNSPFSYMFQPDHAIPITSWFNDRADRQLYELIPFLQQLASQDCDDICTMLSQKRFQF